MADSCMGRLSEVARGGASAFRGQRSQGLETAAYEAESWALSGVQRARRCGLRTSLLGSVGSSAVQGR